MSEKREPGYYAVVVDGNESLAFVTILASGREMVTLLDGSGCDDTSVVFVERVEQWGPRILLDPTLVQVGREELEVLRHAYDRMTDPEFTRVRRKELRWLRELHAAARNENHERLCDALDRLDSLRRREGESDER